MTRRDRCQTPHNHNLIYPEFPSHFRRHVNRHSGVLFLNPETMPVCQLRVSAVAKDAQPDKSIRPETTEGNGRIRAPLPENVSQLVATWLTVLLKGRDYRAPPNFAPLKENTFASTGIDSLWFTGHCYRRLVLVALQLAGEWVSGPQPFAFTKYDPERRRRPTGNHR